MLGSHCFFTVAEAQAPDGSSKTNLCAPGLGQSIWPFMPINRFFSLEPWKSGTEMCLFHWLLCCQEINHRRPLERFKPSSFFSKDSNSWLLRIVLTPLPCLAQQDSERDSVDHILNFLILVLYSGFSYLPLLLPPFPTLFSP